MATRTTLLVELNNRLGDTANKVWDDAEKKGFIDFAIKGLYPSFYQLKVATTVADNGPLQPMPVGARNLHQVGLQRTGSTRARKLRGWTEGDGQAFVPKTGITGDTLIWSWTQGWDAPVSDGATIDIPVDAEDVVVTRAHIRALENLLSERVKLDTYFSLNVRQAASETDIADTIDGLRVHLNDVLARVLPLPEKQA